MIKEIFNNDWKFWVNKNTFELVWSIPEEAKAITLPHDAMIETMAKEESRNGGSTGFRDGEVYNYVKMFFADKEYCNKNVMIKFEGIYMNAFVYINGQLAAKCPFGYSTFYVNMNEYIKYNEENEIRIIVRNGAMTNSRWYSGGGIYRDVYLLVSDLTYINPDGVQIVTENIEEDYAVINITTELENKNHLTQEILLSTSIKDNEGKIVAEDTIPVVLFSNEKRKVAQRIVVSNPNCWSEFSPNLYQCTSKIVINEEVTDINESSFGIRTIKLDAKNGLRINGNTVKLRGACIHHDSGLLGSATYDDAKYRQVRLLKEAGFNAIRMSHQPMSQAMLRACDEIGMYVMDESFDMWTRCKSDYDYGMYFNEWWEKDIESMIRKDFNHPSVILYSIGNEIPEIGTNQGAKICHDICKKVKDLDNTRFTLASINGVFASGDVIGKIISDICKELNNDDATSGNVNDFMTIMDTHMDKIVVHPEVTKRLDKACAYTDIAGYNYMTARYEMDVNNYPNRIMVGSETYPPEIPRNWEIVKKCNQVIGDFTWTGWDYIGEAGVGVPAYNFGEGGFGAKFPCQLAYTGDFDICGYRRPASYFREIVFGLRKNPYIVVQNPDKYGKKLIKTPWVISDSIASWTFNEHDGKKVIVEIYSAGEEVELLCNGKSLGRKASGEKVGYITNFEVLYNPGILEAITYENGNEIGRMKLETVGNERNLVIIEEKEQNKQLIYLQIAICDKFGNIATNEDTTIEISVQGNAELIGFGSGNPKPKYGYKNNITETFNGRALAILKKKNKEENIIVEVKSEKYKDSITIID